MNEPAPPTRDIGPPRQRRRRSVLAFYLALITWTAAQLPMPATAAAFESGVYHTLPGAVVEEIGHCFTSDNRVMPISATLSFDFGVVPPLFTAEITNALRECMEPFLFTVRGTGARLNDGTYLFSGPYLPGYGFDWRFSASTNGQVSWNGNIGWLGGRLWIVRMSDLTLVRDAGPRLAIAQSGSEILVSWPTNHVGYSLEQSASLTAADWTAVTNAVAITGERYSVSVESSVARTFFRLSNQSP